MSELQKLQAHIEMGLSDKITDHTQAFGELTLTTTCAHIYAVLKFLRDDAGCAFTQLIDLCGVDYPARVQRFEVVYHLLSMTHNARVRVKLHVGEGETVPSIIGLYDTANWFERETFDMYGIAFAGHPDLRRLLTDYGFEGYPLRKDFPLTGHVEVRYDPAQARVVYEPVALPQAFRNFDFESPWEGIHSGVAGHHKPPAPISANESEGER